MTIELEKTKLTAEVDVDAAAGIAELKATDKAMDAVARDRTANIKVDMDKAASDWFDSKGRMHDGVTGKFKSMEKGMDEAAESAMQLGQTMQRSFGQVVDGVLDKMTEGFDQSMKSVNSFLTSSFQMTLQAAMYLFLGAAIAGVVAALAPLAALAATAAVAMGALAAAAIGIMMALKPVIEAIQAFGVMQKATNPSTQTATQLARERAGAERALELAIRAHTDAEKALQDALQPASALDQAKADLALREARIAAADASDRLNESNKALNDSASETATSIKAIAKATDEFTGKTVEIVTVQKGKEQSKDSREDLARRHERALLDVEAAQLRIADAEARILELQKQGTELDPSVIAARRQLEDATYAQAEAARQLGEAMAAGGKAGADATNDYLSSLEKLSPAAQKFVDFFTKNISPLLDSVTYKMQEALFPGLLAGLEAITPIIPVFVRGMEQVVGVIGNMARKFGEWLARPETVAIMERIFSTGAQLAGSLGDALLSLSDAFLKILDASLPFTKLVGELIAHFSKLFNEFLSSAEGQRVLKAFFDAATETFGYLMVVLPDVLEAVSKFMEALHEVGLELLNAVIQALIDVLSDKNFQDMMVNLINNLTIAIPQLVDFFLWFMSNWPTMSATMTNLLIGVMDVIHAVQDLLRGPLGALLNWFIENKDDILDVLSNVEEAINFIGDAIDSVQKLWDTLKGAWDEVKDISFSGIFDGLKDEFRNVVNWIIGKWNDFGFTMPVTGTRVDFPDITPIPMAQGGRGTVYKPTLFLGGERGVPEDFAFAPHDKGGMEGMYGGGGGMSSADVDRLIEALKTARPINLKYEERDNKTAGEIAHEIAWSI